MHHLSINIIGDAFADVYCYLEGDMPRQGGDSRLNQPIHTVAGGSGLNTATHLSSLLRSFWNDKSKNRTSNIILQTVINENDDYGKLIVNHCNQHKLMIINRRVSHQPACFFGTNEAVNANNNDKSTGHCAVIVSKGERSFMTHLGCMEDYKGEHILPNIQDLDGTRRKTGTTTPGAHYHIHIAGYFNIPGFWGGKLKTKLQEIQQSLNSNTNTISLVPQHDATEQWDGGILDILDCVDFLILSEVEAKGISKYKGSDSKEQSSTFLEHTINFFAPYKRTHIIVTLGSQGAVVLGDGAVIHHQHTVPVDHPVDPTGAGDAFAAGFIKGFLCNMAVDNDRDEAILEGGICGCAVGTNSVSMKGASAPSTKESIQQTRNSIDEVCNEAKRRKVATPF